MATKKEMTVAHDQLPADIADQLMGETEKLGTLGYSERAEDSLIPILSILQDNSGEIKKRHDRHIEGAEAGDLIIRSLDLVFQCRQPDDGVVFQPAGFQHVWVEWEGEPGEGAVVSQFEFDDMPDDAKQIPNPNSEDGRPIWVRDSGTRLVDTRYHYGNLVQADGFMPLVIPMAGTNHTASRKWTAQMRNMRHPATGKKAPAFFRLYRLGTRFNQRGAQSWFNYSIKDMGWIGDEQLLRSGFDLLKSVSEMRVIPAEEAAVQEEREGDVPI